jgi:hypothetical protein
LPGPREFHGTGLPVPKIRRFSFVSTTGVSHMAPPPYWLSAPDHVSPPGWPCCGTIAHVHRRRPLLALKACMPFETLPPSPPESPVMTMPLT